ncbi:MAG: hypothetical protein AAFS10_03735 [Myxococcota bacterium]
MAFFNADPLPTEAAQDPFTFETPLDLTHLETSKARVLSETVSRQQGHYTINFTHPTLDPFIVVASLPNGARDVWGINRTNGTVSWDNAIDPTTHAEQVWTDDETADTNITYDLGTEVNFTIATSPHISLTDDGIVGRDSAGDEVWVLEPPIMGELAEPDVNSVWSGVTLVDAAGETLGDATHGPAMVESSWPAVVDGDAVRLMGRVNDPAVGDAIVRLQHGSNGCAEEGAPARLVEMRVPVKEGRLTSDGGAFWPLVLSGRFERIQLDLDSDPTNGNESHTLTVMAPCVEGAAPLTVTLLWNRADVDVDLYVWPVDGPPTYQGSRSSSGQRGESAYGTMKTVAQGGWGPEVFALYPAQTSGLYAVRAHMFSGPPEDTLITVRVVAERNGVVEIDTVEAVLNWGMGESWINVGAFTAGPQ